LGQQSVHLTLGILRTSQAVFYALSFFWLDGFAVPAPAQVTQTVGLSLNIKFRSGRSETQAIVSSTRAWRELSNKDVDLLLNAITAEKESIQQSQQSVHPTLGSLARFQAFFYASAFSQSDGVPPPAPARVTQTVGLTKRAPDAGDSAHISSSFLRLIIFLAGRLRRPRPSAGNANRCEKVGLFE
jgi:hypothetical protein